MPLQIPPEMIKEIAEQLDCGMRCFYNKKTGELDCYPDEIEDASYYSDGPWKEVMDKIDENFADYVRFFEMESHESFKVMENFINQMPPDKIQAKFKEAIQRKRPFQQFRHLLPDYPELREQWFDFKDQNLANYVQEQIDTYNLDVDEGDTEE